MMSCQETVKFKYTQLCKRVISKLIVSSDVKCGETCVKIVVTIEPNQRILDLIDFETNLQHNMMHLSLDHTKWASVLHNILEDTLKPANLMVQTEYKENDKTAKGFMKSNKKAKRKIEDDDAASMGTPGSYVGDDDVNDPETPVNDPQTPIVHFGRD